MDELLLPIGDDTNKPMRTVLAQFDGPAYLRRARRVQAALEHLHAHCRRRRDEALTMVRLRLGVLSALAGDWNELVPWLLAQDQAAQLQALHAELAPDLRMPLEITRSQRRLRSAFQELLESVARFNERWAAFLRGVELDDINGLIEGYNRWYVLEKECIVGAHRIARQGFEPLPLLTRAALEAAYPPLPVPQSST